MKENKKREKQEYKYHTTLGSQLPPQMTYKQLYYRSEKVCLLPRDLQLKFGVPVQYKSKCVPKPFNYLQNNAHNKTKTYH